MTTTDVETWSATAANLLDLSQRQIQRPLGKVQDEGAITVRYKLGGQQPNNRVSAFKHDYFLSLTHRAQFDFALTPDGEAL